MLKAEKILYPGSREGAKEVEILEVCPSCGHTKIQVPDGTKGEGEIALMEFGPLLSVTSKLPQGITKLTFKEVAAAHRILHPQDQEGCLLCRGISERKSVKFLKCLATVGLYTSGGNKARWYIVVEPDIKEDLLEEISHFGVYERVHGHYTKST